VSVTKTEVSTIFKGCLYRVKQINFHLSEMEILAQPLCETLLPLDPIVFTPTTFRHTKRLPIRISRPSHKKFHFKKAQEIGLEVVATIYDQGGSNP
jgi:hypothetical protein